MGKHDGKYSEWPRSEQCYAARRVIYLHKIVPLFLLPTGVTLLLVLSGLILRRKGLIWAGLVVLWLSSTALVGKEAIRAAERWQTRIPVSAMPSAHAIVVLSAGRVQPPGTPELSEWTDADRFYGGIELYKANKAPLLIFTGGWLPWEPDAKLEGEVLIQYAADLGVPANRMATTGKVTNTRDESHAVAAMLRERFGARAAPRVLLVTSAFHMRRAQMLFQRTGIEIVPFPVDFKVPAGDRFSVLDLLPSAGNLGYTELALREFYGLVFYSIFNN